MAVASVRSFRCKHPATKPVRRHNDHVPCCATDDAVVACGVKADLADKKGHRRVADCRHRGPTHEQYRPLAFSSTDLPNEHLEDEHPQAPPVHAAAVVLFGQHLWGEELGCAAEGRGAIAVAHPCTQCTVNRTPHLTAGLTSSCGSSDGFKPSLHSPKSAILTKPSVSISRLSSFKSLGRKQTLGDADDKEENRSVTCAAAVASHR